jgi:hypothetical protein
MKRFIIFLLPTVFFTGCVAYEHTTCEAGRQIECACANDEASYQVCLDDGSGWGACLCPCSSNSDCAANEYCDLTTAKCKLVTCDHATQCANKCCGDDGCGTGTDCENNCVSGTTCNQTSCTCSGGCSGDAVCCDAVPCPSGKKCLDGRCTDCCPNTEADRYYVDIAGQVDNHFSDEGNGNIGVAAISPMEALTLPDPTKHATSNTAANGSFFLDCFYVHNIPLGIVVMTDDSNWDGTAGTLYPTGTAVVGWEENHEKVCTTGAVVFALTTNIVAVIDQQPDIDVYKDGFIMGRVVDAAGQPIAGANIRMKERRGDNWVDPVKVYYPDATFQDLTSATTTTPNGFFILPFLNFVVGAMSVKAEKTGMTFNDQMAAPKGEFVLFLLISQVEP